MAQYYFIFITNCRHGNPPTQFDSKLPRILPTPIMFGASLLMFRGVLVIILTTHPSCLVAMVGLTGTKFNSFV